MLQVNWSERSLPHAVSINIYGRFWIWWERRRKERDLFIEVKGSPELLHCLLGQLWCLTFWLTPPRKHMHPHYGVKGSDLNVLSLASSLILWNLTRVRDSAVLNCTFHPSLIPYAAKWIFKFALVFLPHIHFSWVDIVIMNTQSSLTQWGLHACSTLCPQREDSLPLVLFLQFWWTLLFF